MLSSYFWLFSQGCECSFLFLLNPVGWVLIILAIVSGRRARRDKRWPATTWMHLAWPLLIAGVCCGWGQANWHAPGSEPSPESISVLYWLLLLYVLGCLAIITVNRQARAATTAVFSLGTLPVLGCSMVATMAITGNWM